MSDGLQGGPHDPSHSLLSHNPHALRKDSHLGSVERWGRDAWPLGFCKTAPVRLILVVPLDA